MKLSVVGIIAVIGSGALVTGCVDVYGPPAYYSYGGFYDDYYGPFYGGYWGPGGAFYYSDRGGRHFHRDNGRHFRTGPAHGFHPIAGPRVRRPLPG